MQSFYTQVLGWILIASPFFVFGATLLGSEPGVAREAPAQHAEDVIRADKIAGDKKAATPVARVNQVAVTAASGGMEVEITSTRTVPLRSQVVTTPDRLILDFPGALPGSDLRDQSINRGQVKGIRVSLFAQNPPVTRVVIDLKSGQPYRIYPSGKTVIVKLMTGERQATAGVQGDGPQIKAVAYTPPPAKPTPVLDVQFQNGRLGIVAHDVSLAQVLSEVQHRTGAEIAIPPVAAQEQVVANIDLQPARDALTALLNGSRFNFVMIGADDDPARLKSLILTFRGGGVSQPAIAPPPSPVPEPTVVDAPPEPEPQPEMQAQPDPQPQPQEGPGQQDTPQPQQENPPPQ